MPNPLDDLKSLELTNRIENTSRTRRHFIKALVALVGSSTVLLANPLVARACLYGTFIVRCRNGHDDIVEDGTCNHDCEKCGVKAFSNGEGYIVCPSGHANYVQTGTSRRTAMTSYRCRARWPNGAVCQQECRRN